MPFVGVWFHHEVLSCQCDRHTGEFAPTKPRATCVLSPCLLESNVDLLWERVRGSGLEAQNRVVMGGGRTGVAEGVGESDICGSVPNTCGPFSCADLPTWQWVYQLLPPSSGLRKPGALETGTIEEFSTKSSKHAGSHLIIHRICVASRGFTKS